MKLFLFAAIFWLAGCASTADMPTKPDTDPLFENQLAIKNLDDRFEQFKISTEQRLDELEKKLGSQSADERKGDIDSVVEEISYLRSKVLINEDDYLRESGVVRHRQALKNMTEEQRKCWFDYDRLQWDTQNEDTLGTGMISNEGLERVRAKAAKCAALK